LRASYRDHGVTFSYRESGANGERTLVGAIRPPEEHAHDSMLLLSEVDST